MISDLIVGFIAETSSALDKPFELEVIVFRDCHGLLKSARLDLASQVRSQRRSSNRVTSAEAGFVNFNAGL